MRVVKKVQKPRPRYDVTVNSLVRANVHALLRDRGLRDKAFNKHGRGCFEVLKNTYKGPHDIEKYIDVDKWLAARNPDRWSRKKFGESSGVGGPKMNRLLDDSGERAPQDFDLTDIMKISRALNIPLSFLYSPSRKHLEENAILVLKDFDPPIDISASQWLAWANGLSILPGMDAVATNFNSLLNTNTPMPGEKFNPGEEGYPGEDGSQETIAVDMEPLADTQVPLDVWETRRTSEALSSDVSATDDAWAGNPFTSTPAAPLEFDNEQLHQHALHKARFVSLLLHDVREAFYLMADEGRLHIAVSDIENSMNKIKQDLEALALNVDEDLQSKTGPLTEAHLLNMLEIACMKVENIIQEKTHNLNAKIT